MIAFIRSFRPLKLVAVTVIVTVVGLAIGGVVWIDMYQPLAFGNLASSPNRSVDAPGGDSTSVVVRQGRPFSLAIEIRNYGRFL